MTQEQQDRFTRLATYAQLKLAEALWVAITVDCIRDGLAFTAKKATANADALAAAALELSK